MISYGMNNMCYTSPLSCVNCGAIINISYGFDMDQHNLDKIFNKFKCSQCLNIDSKNNFLNKRISGIIKQSSSQFDNIKNDLKEIAKNMSNKEILSINMIKQINEKQDKNWNEIEELNNFSKKSIKELFEKLEIYEKMKIFDEKKMKLEIKLLQTKYKTFVNQKDYDLQIKKVNKLIERKSEYISNNFDKINEKILLLEGKLNKYEKNINSINRDIDETNESQIIRIKEMKDLFESNIIRNKEYKEIKRLKGSLILSDMEYKKNKVNVLFLTKYSSYIFVIFLFWNFILTLKFFDFIIN